jgi:hypothetical protein
VPPSAVDGPLTTIPDEFAFTTAELPPGLTSEEASGAAGAELVDGPDCAGAPPGASPAAARRWVWSTGSGAADGLSVSLTVTGWREGEAAPAFTAAIAAAGRCTRDNPHGPHALPPVSAGQSWAATSELDGRHYVRALVQFEDGVVEVQVQSQKGVEAAKLVDKLVLIQADRLRGILRVPA